MVFTKNIHFPQACIAYQMRQMSNSNLRSSPHIALT